MLNKQQIEAIAQTIMDQYQRAGQVDPTTVEGHIWRAEIMDRCSAAISVLATVLEEANYLDIRLSGDGCDPAIPMEGMNYKEGMANYKKTLFDCL